MSASCIYKISSKLDGRLYIGSAIDFDKRKYEHLKRLRKGTHHSKKLQHFYWKYGESSLDFSIIELCEIDKLLEREQYWIDETKAYTKSGFNICPTAGSSLGRILSEDTKNKIRDRAIGRKQTAEQVRNRSLKNTGKKRSKEAVKLTISVTQKLTYEQAEIIRMKLKNGFTQMQMAKEYKVCQRTISRIKQNISYLE
jgi:group I intron endonuclease